VYKGTKDAAFTTSSNNDIWVQLLEKAWAKSNGGYDKTVFGLSSEVLRAITGAPVFTFGHESMRPDELWKQLNAGIKSGYTMLCSLEEETYNYEESDFISNFSYTVIGAYKVNTGKGNVKLIKIRNPWQNFEWNGDWSDSSNLWTQNIKDDVEWESNSKGIIYMSIEDYQANFMTTVICKVQDTYEYSTIEVKQDIGGYTILKFQINRDQKAFFNLSQLAYRIVPKEYGYHPYNAKMILAKLDKENKDFPLQFIDAIVADKDDIPLEADLIAGEYYLFCEVDWDESRPHDSFVVS
jgi:Calpain family cysteine protease